MKTLVTTFLIIAAAAAPLPANPTMVKLDIRYKGVDAKWFSDLSPRTKEILRSESGAVGLPLVVVKSGELTKLELIREYRLDSSTLEGPVIPCGVVLDLTPKVDGSDIRVSGKGVLRRSTNKSAAGTATRFEAKENLIDLKLEDGTPKAVNLEGGGQMVLTATLIDATGRPIKK
jgi:hypothetical protein